MQQHVAPVALECTNDPCDRLALRIGELGRLGLAPEGVTHRGLPGAPRRAAAYGATSASARAGVEP